MINNKGSIVDAWIAFAFIVAVAIVGIVGLMLVQTLQGSEYFGGIMTAEGETALATTAEMLVTIDQVLLFLFVGILIVSLILAFFIPAHPIFIGIFVLTEVILIAFSPVIVNSYNAVVSTPQLATQANYFVYTGTFIDNLIPIMVGHMALLMIITFFKGGQTNVASANF